MDLVKNRKGSTGFTVEAYNFQGEGKLLSFDENAYSAGFLVYLIRNVEVRSCGKKQMLLNVLDGINRRDKTAGEIFSPDLKIYKTLGCAKEFARAEIERVKPVIIENIKVQAEKARKDSEKYAAYEGKAELIESFAEKIKSGELSFKVAINEVKT